MTEAELQEAVIEAAQWAGYLVAHFRPARTADGGWVTAMTGDAGFPDLVLAHKRSHRVLFRELKSEKGRPTPQQLVWLTATRGRIWRPIDWLDGTIEVELKAGAEDGSSND
jgi:hypothetical protein